jgi:hypothetical protein
MMAAYTEANLAVCLETAIRCAEAEHGRAKRVRWRKDDASMVAAFAIHGIRRPSEGKVPLEEV